MEYVLLLIQLFIGFGAILVAHCLLKFICGMDASLVLGRGLHRSIDSTKFDNAHALVATIEARGQTRYEATLNSSESKKKEVCKLEKPIERESTMKT
mgnify:CR=1 FL=1